MKILLGIFASFLLAITISFPVQAADEALSATQEQPLPPTEEQSSYKQEDFTDSATLQVLNKITARTSSLDITFGKAGKFGNLEIALIRCWKSPQDEDPESKALLKITEQIPGENAKLIFHGWMFASSPALSTLEHAVYDVTVITCKNSEKNSEQNHPEAEEEKKAKD